MVVATDFTVSIFAASIAISFEVPEISTAVETIPGFPDDPVFEISGLPDLAVSVSTLDRDVDVSDVAVEVSEVLISFKFV